MIRGKQTTLNRLRQAAASAPEDLIGLEEEIQSCQADLAKHREEASESHAYFVEVTATCATRWKRIAALEDKSNLNEDESEELAGLKSKFEIVLSANYEMSKLVPFWASHPSLAAHIIYRSCHTISLVL